jgi:hypothetical protein
LAAALAGVGGNLAGLLIYSGSHLGVGASGMVLGGAGLLAAQALGSLGKYPGSRKFVVRSWIAGLLLFVLFGLSPESDLVAHAGGFVSGLALGSLLVRVPKICRNPQVNRAAGFLLVLASLVTGWLAFR